VDGTKWSNVSDLKGIKGEIAMTYNVQALPLSYLIDKNGKIIEIFSGYTNDSFVEIFAAIEGNRK